VVREVGQAWQVVQERLFLFPLHDLLLHHLSQLLRQSHHQPIF
jgi:hypothetical protein